MCGIAGAISPDRTEARRAVEVMCERMLRRGPDDSGIEYFAARGGSVGLGSRRLAIIDPSPAGHQPMVDADRGTAIVYNGMLYNFRELRARLEGLGERFQSDCDTEVVLRAYGVYGGDCVRYFRGMFAFAVWDARSEQLFLARDRLGIKPLYYWQDGSRFAFASQVKVVLASGLVKPRLSADGIASYLATGAVREPRTAIEGIHALPPGHVGVLDDGRLELRRYWGTADAPRIDVSNEAEAAAELRRLLLDSVACHLVSDAPLGVFLSGGLDSSAIAALAARNTNRLTTLSVVFENSPLSESAYSRLVADRLGSQHVELTLSPADLQDMLPDAFHAMDQPSYDGINTYVVSRAAHQAGLKVALSGLGADELYDGYGHARRVAWLERAGRIPHPFASVVSRAARSGRGGARGDKLRQWLGGSYEAGSSYELVRSLFPRHDLARLLREPSRVDSRRARHETLGSRGDVVDEVTAFELTNYLRDVLLRDTDAMGMGNSVEVRVPFLDDRVVEWSLGLPGKIRARKPKALLVAAVGDTVPREISTRKKHGFLLPLQSWTRAEMQAEVGDTILNAPDAVREIVDMSAMTDVWEVYSRTGTHWLRPWALYALSQWTSTIDGGGG